MSTIPEEQDFEIISLVEKLREAPERLPQDMAAGNARFLAEAQSYARPAAPGLNGHQKAWKGFFPPKVHPKLALIPTLMVIFILVFGGTGVTVYAAAQSSLPDQPLYSIKLASEDLRTNLPASSQTRVDLAMDFADLRLQEALQLAANGKPIPAAVWERMENHIDFGLLTAARLDDQPLRQQMLKIQSRLRLELDRLSSLKTDPRYANRAEGIRATLLARLQLVTIGLNDPAAFREYMQLDQSHPTLQPITGTTAASTAMAQPPQPTSTLTPQPPQPTRTSAPQASSTHSPGLTPQSQSTQSWGGQTGPAPAPTHSWDNNNCSDCGNWDGGWNGGSGGHSGGHDGSGGGGGWHH